MKRTLLTAVLLCVFATTGNVAAAYSAESTEGQKAKEPHVAGYISNKFKDNWELSVGVGPTFNLRSKNSAKDAVSVAGHIGASKWIHPVFGVRLDFEVGQYGHNDDNSWMYVYAHPDFLVNLTNWICGYKDYRVYNAILYVGAGFGASGMGLDSESSYGTEGLPRMHFLGNVGLQNRFHVCQALSIDLQLQLTMGKGTFRPVGGHGRGNHFYGPSAMVGLTYKFNDRTFTRCGATADEVEAMQNTMAALKDKADQAADECDNLKKALDDKTAEAQQAEDELAALKDEAAKRAARDARRRQAESAKEAIDRDVYNEILFYEIGVGNLSEYHTQRLDLIAEHIKADDEKQVYKVEGFADAQTGSAKCNARLADKRARLAYEYLLSKGVSEDRLEYINGGTVNCPFGKPVHNRVVVIY